MAEITVNGEPLVLDGVTPHTTALDFLRDRGLTGAKEGCAEGECGACCVLVARPPADGTAGAEWTSVNTCLVSAASLIGQEVVTSEGLGTPADLHPVQHEMAERGGSQCGYCTPGFVCSMAAEYYRHDRRPSPSANGTHGDNGFDLHALSGNLCRCTGYRPIRDAAYALGPPVDGDPLAVRRSTPAAPPPPARVDGDGAAFVRPDDLADALQLLTDEEATPVAGATDLGCRDQPPRLAARADGRGRPAGRAPRAPLVRRRAHDRRRPVAHRDRTPPGRAGPGAGRAASGSSRRGPSATAPPSAATSAPARRSATARPCSSPSAPRWSWSRSPASAASPWPTTSPATAPASGSTVS